MPEHKSRSLVSMMEIGLLFYRIGMIVKIVGFVFHSRISIMQILPKPRTSKPLNHLKDVKFIDELKKIV